MSDTAPGLVIAIDGPAASGKSTVARTVAYRLGFIYVNSGAMYRAFTWHALNQGVPTDDPDRLVELLARTRIECGLEEKRSTVRIDGIDPTEHLTSPDVNSSVSSIAAVPQVRAHLVAIQRRYAEAHDVVMEGRDIGSAVFPHTPYKFYIDASQDVRAQRRVQQGLQDSIGTRDRIDSSRRTSPLVIAEDAHLIDSSHLTIDGVVGEIVGRLKMKGLPIGDCVLTIAGRPASP